MQRAAAQFAQRYGSINSEQLINETRSNTGAELSLWNPEFLPIRQGIMTRPNLSLEEMRSVFKEAAVNTSNPEYFDIIQNPNDNNRRLLYIHLLKNGDILIMTKAMGLLGEANNMFSAFMLRASVVVYVIGFVLIFIVSGFFSRPVVKIANITRKMANLDFGEKLKVKSNDEIGELMTSINLMADDLSGAIGHLNDVNRKLERELSKEKSLEKMRRRFVSDVSHELKNPISIILGYADGLIRHMPKTEKEREEYCGIIADEAKRMNQLVKDLLDLSAYESGTFAIEKMQFDVNTLIEDALERFEHLYENKQLHIVYEEEKRYEIYGDRLRTGQVIINLLGNAFKYVNENGIIRICVVQQDKKFRLEIANTGSLLGEKELDLIWNSFYQVDTENHGNGLGLAIVKSIVELHQGSCRAYVQDGFNCFEVNW